MRVILGLILTAVQMSPAAPTSPTYSPQTQEALETMAARILLSVGRLPIVALQLQQLILGLNHSF
jgi:hypothetical protein